MFTLPRSLRPALPVALLALSLAGLAPRAAVAQSSSLATLFAIGLERAQAEPYNYTGRIFDVGDAAGIASGTLLRRHTVLTAGHVVFDPTVGFLKYGLFSRGLYEDFTFQQSQIVSVNALSGYQAAVTAFTNDSVEAFSQDLGYVLLQDAPRDGSWGTYRIDPTGLASTANQFFLLGYPGVSFDGRTMAYLVPTSPYVSVGAPGSGLYFNTSYLSEPGTSGGPIYAYDGTRQFVVAETVAGNADTSGEFTENYVHAIDRPANRLLVAAEYTAGLIKKVKIKGPRTVSPGTTIIYKAMPRFVVPDSNNPTGVATTDRYTEIKLVTSTPGTSTQPAVTVKKLTYTTFQVTFDKSIRPKTTTTLSAFYSKTDAVLNSTITITVQ